MRIQNGGFMAMETGGAYVQSIKQKLSTNILTEAKLVGVDDFLTQVIWSIDLVSWEEDMVKEKN